MDTTYLEGILSREALVAMTTREWLDSQMNSLVSLQVVVPVEALGALVASEGSVVLRVWLRMSIHVVHLCGVAAVEVWDHTSWYSAHGMTGEDCCTSHAGVAVWSILLGVL